MKINLYKTKHLNIINLLTIPGYNYLANNKTTIFLNNLKAQRLSNIQ